MDCLTLVPLNKDARHCGKTRNTAKERKKFKMFGCHNCDKKPAPGTPYEESPCATCRTIKNPPPDSHYREDPGSYQILSVPHPSTIENEGEDFDYGDNKQLFTTMLRAFSQSLRLLVNLKEKHPQTYRILEAKLDDPSLSYTELAVRFSCRKQNVQYHLKKAVSLCPELSHALLIDTRFTAGYSALKRK